MLGVWLGVWGTRTLRASLSGTSLQRKVVVIQCLEFGARAVISDVFFLSESRIPLLLTVQEVWFKD